jgi:hypothetical protein
MPSGDAQRTWFPEMIVRLRSEWHEGISIPALIGLRDKLDETLHRISGRPEHPDTDYDLPQVWDDGPRGGTARQRARLDSGRGTIRDRFEGPNPGGGKGVGGIP